ncbi:MAG: FtsX-like permease family protein, partial [Candidatus Acidiferrales bacterium]
VRGVALANDLPLEGQDTNGNPAIEGRLTNNGDNREVDIVGQHAVNADFFRTMGIPLRKGRTFTARDTREAPHVAVINEAMAKRFWPNEDPIGKRFRLFTRDGWTEVIGVVGDVRHNGLSSDTSLEAYAHVLQSPWPYTAIVLRSEQSTEQLAAAVRAEVAAVDAEMPVHGVRSMDKVVGDTLQQRRMTLGLIGMFAGLALTLAAVGIYGVMAYNVAQRTHEIGVRMALGAQTTDVGRLIVGEGARLALAGIALGVAGALGLTRLLEGLLYGVTAADPVTFALVPLLLATVALAACAIPARRAAKVDPMVALRHE